MRRWRAAPSAGGLVGILALLLCLGGVAGVTLRLIPAADGKTLVLAALWSAVAAIATVALVLLLLLWGYLTLGYRLEEANGGALVLRWAWKTVRLPLDEIEYLGPARPIIAPAAGRWLWPWPGYYLSALHDGGLGRIQLLATLAPRRQLLVCSARGCYGISPDRPAQLLARYQELREEALWAGPALLRAFPALPARAAAAAVALEDEEEAAFPTLAGSGQRAFRDRTAGRALALLQDRPSVGLTLAGGALIAAMLWSILLRYDIVPQTLPLHYDATGHPDRIGTPREIFILPLITALVAVANIALAWSVVRFDRFAARLLLGGTCLVQAVAWVALLKLF